MAETIKGLLIRVGEYPVEIEFEATLEKMQELVGGYIERCPDICKNQTSDIFVNEEGKFTCAPNRALVDIDNIYNKDFIEPDGVFEIICGDFFCIGHDGEGNSRSLDDKEMDFLKNYFTSISSPNSGLLKAIEIKTRAAQHNEQNLGKPNKKDLDR